MSTSTFKALSHKNILNIKKGTVYPYSLSLAKKIFNEFVFKSSDWSKKQFEAMINIAILTQTRINQALFTEEEYNTCKDELVNADFTSNEASFYTGCLILLAKHESTNDTKINWLFMANTTNSLNEIISFLKENKDLTLYRRQRNKPIMEERQRLTESEKYFIDKSLTPNQYSSLFPNDFIPFDVGLFQNTRKDYETVLKHLENSQNLPNTNQLLNALEYALEIEVYQEKFNELDDGSFRLHEIEQEHLNIRNPNVAIFICECFSDENILSLDISPHKESFTQIIFNFLLRASTKLKKWDFKYKGDFLEKVFSTISHSVKPKEADILLTTFSIKGGNSVVTAYILKHFISKISSLTLLEFYEDLLKDKKKFQNRDIFLNTLLQSKKIPKERILKSFDFLLNETYFQVNSSYADSLFVKSVIKNCPDVLEKYEKVLFELALKINTTPISNSIEEIENNICYLILKGIITSESNTAIEIYFSEIMCGSKYNLAILFLDIYEIKENFNAIQQIFFSIGKRNSTGHIMPGQEDVLTRFMEKFWLIIKPENITTQLLNLLNLNYDFSPITINKKQIELEPNAKKLIEKIFSLEAMTLVNCKEFFMKLVHSYREHTSNAKIILYFIDFVDKNIFEEQIIEFFTATIKKGDHDLAKAIYDRAKDLLTAGQKKDLLRLLIGGIRNTSPNSIPEQFYVSLFIEIESHFNDSEIENLFTTAASREENNNTAETITKCILNTRGSAISNETIYNTFANTTNNRLQNEILFYVHNRGQHRNITLPTLAPQIPLPGENIQTASNGITYQVHNFTNLVLNIGLQTIKRLLREKNITINAFSKDDLILKFNNSPNSQNAKNALKSILQDNTYGLKFLHWLPYIAAFLNSDELGWREPYTISELRWEIWVEQSFGDSGNAHTNGGTACIKGIFERILTGFQGIHPIIQLLLTPSIVKEAIKLKINVLFREQMNSIVGKLIFQKQITDTMIQEECKKFILIKTQELMEFAINEELNQLTPKEKEIYFISEIIENVKILREAQIESDDFKLFVTDTINHIYDIGLNDGTKLKPETTLMDAIKSKHNTLRHVYENLINELSKFNHNEFSNKINYAFSTRIRDDFIFIEEEIKNKITAINIGIEEIKLNKSIIKEKKINLHADENTLEKIKNNTFSELGFSFYGNTDSMEHYRLKDNTPELREKIAKQIELRKNELENLDKLLKDEFIQNNQILDELNEEKRLTRKFANLWREFSFT